MSDYKFAYFEKLLVEYCVVKIIYLIICTSTVQPYDNNNSKKNNRPELNFIFAVRLKVDLRFFYTAIVTAQHCTE